MIGHTFAACGAIESAVCAKSIMQSKIHPTLNFLNGDDHCNLNYVKNQSINQEVNYCISNNSAIGGYNTSLVFKKTNA